MNRNEFQQSAKSFRAGRITLEQFSDLVFPSSTSNGAEAVEAEGSRPALPARELTAHKGDFGRVLVIGGSDSMAGAISLCGMAALRSGSGLVTVATPDTEQQTVESFSPCYMTIGFDESKGRFSKSSIDEILAKCEWADVVAVGPGMGRGKSLQKLMARLYAELGQPVVIDADGLNNLADASADLTTHAGMRIMTPHPGEFQGLIATQITTRAELEKRAVEFAKKNSIVLVLKGHQTLITDGEQSFTNPTGNPGMATAGAGDVLTGIIASLIGQGMDLISAARLGTEVHGAAGDLAAEHHGQVSMISSDLLEFLPTAFQTH